MKTRRLIFGMLVSATLAFATSIKTPEKTVEDIVSEADHVVVGKIMSVTMRDKNRREVRDVKAETGPGSGHVISIRIGVGKSDVLKSSAKDFPAGLMYDLWEGLILDLASMKELEGRSFIILLEGDQLLPHGVAPFDFMWPPEWRDRVANVIADEKKKPNQPPQRNAGSRPSSDDSPASETSSSLGPRG